MKIKIIDYYSIKSFHEIVNLSFIEMFSILFDDVSYYSGKSAQDNILKLSKKIKGDVFKNVTFKQIFVIETDTKLFVFLKNICGFFVVLYHYFFSSKNSLIFFNYTNPFALPFICFFNILLKHKVIFTFHGELENLERRISILKPAGLYIRLIKFSFKYLFKKGRCVALVLGDSIRDNIINHYSNMNDCIVSICHPYYIEEKTFSSNIMKTDNKLRLGTVGSMNREKGIFQLLNLSDNMKLYIEKGSLEIYSIGKVNEKDIVLSNNIQWKGSVDGLSREDYDKYIEQLDYILYLYPSNSYKFTASGAIMDAIKKRKPIISLNNDFFSYLFKDGCPGYIVDSLNEMQLLIEQLIKNKTYNSFSHEFDLIKKKIDVKENAKELIRQLNNIVNKTK